MPGSSERHSERLFEIEPSDTRNCAQGLSDLWSRARGAARRVAPSRPLAATKDDRKSTRMDANSQKPDGTGGLGLGFGTWGLFRVFKRIMCAACAQDLPTHSVSIVATGGSPVESPRCNLGGVGASPSTTQGRVLNDRLRSLSPLLLSDREAGRTDFRAAELPEHFGCGSKPR